MKKTILILFGLLILIFTISYFRIAIIHFLEEFALWAYPNDVNRNAEITKLIINIIGGIVVIFGLRAALIRAKASQNSVEIQSKSIDNQTTQIKLSTQSQTNEVFKNAVEHLGSEKESIVLGGIYELHFIATENPSKYAEIVSNILCSKIRTEASIKKEAEDISKTICQTIIDLILKTNIYNSLDKDISFCNLNSIKFSVEEIVNTNLNFSRIPYELENINFTNCKISGTKSIIGRYKNLVFDNCHLFGSYFRGTQFTNVFIKNSSGINKLICLDCEFNDVLLHFDFTASKFLGCEFKDTSFGILDLSSIDFSCSSFHNIDFGTSKIINCNFSGCGFVNTKTYNWIQNCKFLGIKNDSKYYSLFFEKQLEKSLNVSNMKGLSYNETTFLKNTVSKLTEQEMEKIKKVYQENLDIDNKRKKANR
ncbi:hypothetical protein LDL77_05960 [Flagellimonas marinaquae]|nr:hypothetical protein LDL77_05960 [Allomuricauda aquimarina]